MASIAEHNVVSCRRAYLEFIRAFRGEGVIIVVNGGGDMDMIQDGGIVEFVIKRWEVGENVFADFVA